MRGPNELPVRACVAAGGGRKPRARRGPDRATSASAGRQTLAPPLATLFRAPKVEEFMLWDLPHVAHVIAHSDDYKPNCGVVVMDFLVSHDSSLSGVTSSRGWPAACW